MALTSISDWKAAFKEDLEGRAGLSGVSIFDAEPTVDRRNRESIVLGDMDLDVEYISFLTQEESWTVTGDIQIHKPNTAKAARDRALALLEEVRAQIAADPEASTSVWDSQFLGASIEEDVYPEGGRWCRVEFRIGVTVHD